MFSLPGTLLLLLIVILHPQDSIEWLQTLKPVYTALGLAIFGLALDLRLRIVKFEPTRQFWWVAAFFVWCIITAVKADVGALGAAFTFLFSSVCVFVLVAHGVHTFKGLQKVMGLYLACALFLAFVGVHQHYAPTGCVDREAELQVWDGRACDPAIWHECELSEGALPGAEYACIHIGLFGTTSLGERVRYMGMIEDPNVLALLTGIGMPFSFAFFARKRTSLSALLLVCTLSLCFQCAIFTQSRGGQLVVLVVLGTYFLNQFGIRGLLLAVPLFLPVFFLGGREGGDDSSMERMEIAVEGIRMFLAHPIFGVGLGKFVEHNRHTAHNSFVLSPAELGFPGMVLWTSVIYLSLKIPVTALLRYRSKQGRTEAAAAASDWSMALMSALLGMTLGIFFLSFCYNENLWMLIGSCGALHTIIKKYDPDFRVDFTRWELVGVACGDATLLSVWYTYTRWKTGMW